jgi:transcriptional regulator with XRE-family HTH domain
MPNKVKSFKTARELQVDLGQRIRRLRLQRNLDQRTTAENAGIAEKSLRNLEAGRGSSLETFVRTLKALDFLDGIEMLAPEPSINPLALLKSAKPRQRARHRQDESR